MITIGSLFSGIGGFELGLERAIPNAKTIWQVEQNEFCKKILKQHWADAQIYNDVRDITSNNVERVDILCGGFPCQDLSVAGKGKGINAERSGLWWEMHRIINELQPRIAVMENVPAITFRGLGAVLGSLSEIGYNAEWCTIRASDFGAPHKRERWFCIAYATDSHSFARLQTYTTSDTIRNERNTRKKPVRCNREYDATNSYSERLEKDATIQSGVQCRSSRVWSNTSGGSDIIHRDNQRGGYWKTFPSQSPICGGDDGVPNRMDRVKALGNAIVPQCSEWIGHQIVQSGLLDDLLGGKND